MRPKFYKPYLASVLFSFSLTPLFAQHKVTYRLEDAALKGDLVTAKKLIEGGANIKGIEADKAMQCAVKSNSYDVLKYLLENGGDPNARDSYGRTLLMNSANNGNVKLVNLILSFGADPNAKDAQGKNALMSVDGEDFLSILHILRDWGANIDDKDNYGLNAAMKFVKSLTPLTLDFCLERGSNPNLKDRRGNTALMHLAWWTQYDLVYSGYEEILAAKVLSLKKYGADMNSKNSIGMTALMYAAGWDHLPILEALIESGARIDIRDNLGRTALTWAARVGSDSKIVKRLLREGSQIGLAEAMLLKDYKKVKHKLANGDNIKVFGPYNDNLLMMAAEDVQLDLVQDVLKRGAEVNARDREGMTALMLAVAGRKRNSIPGGSTYFDVNERAIRMEIIQLLLTRHANPNLRNRVKDTALSLSEESKFTLAIEALLSHGIKPKPKH